ncbi:hypothetical protein [Streptomyces natalensis]|uniref:Uncharacterized protein n=1 Tax=Streptomyces natalensis ATCC 27448 TaxID=1240678 RepID=A0A0D7CFH5_9ACTN|nr:hypothetical protein [Streptomyces natalensis]KIZ14640.1 hypothetical protein SNA_31580 [Streptomyces natalensis ATCC 27448]
MAAHLDAPPPTAPAPPEHRPRTPRGRTLLRLACGLLVLAALGYAGLRLHHRLNTIDLPQTDTVPQGGYTLTVYFTPSEAYHHGPRRSIRGQVCAGQSLPYSFPADYLERVRLEGFGKTARGDYLGWDFDRHCYFATRTPPMGSHDNALVPWQSVAANHLSTGTQIRVTDCGPGVPGEVCTRVKSAHWRVDDLCSIGCDDVKHLDLYIGEQSRADIEDEDFYFVTKGATIQTSTPQAQRW